MSKPSPEETQQAMGVSQAFYRQLRAHLDSQIDDPHEVLYHYTSAGGLKGILESGCIWASHYAYLNDPAEVREGSKFIREALAASDSKLANEAAAMLSGPAGRYIASRNTYLASFSETGDDLPQWLLYADGGRGVSIGFDLTGVKSRLAKVIYRELDFHRRLQSVLNAAEDIWGKESRKAGLTGERAKKARRHCASRLLTILEWGCRYKPSSWEHEKEWRLLSRFRASNVPVRLRGSVLVPYVEERLWEKPVAGSAALTPTLVKEITLGPLQDPDTGAEAVKKFWLYLGLTYPDETGTIELQLPQVSPSTIEYRQT